LTKKCLIGNEFAMV